MTKIRSFVPALLTIVLLSLGAAAPARADTPDATGLWLDQGGEAAIRIAHCGRDLCGSLYWMKDPNDDNGRPSRDTENPNPALRGQPLCGLTILSNFKPDRPGMWTDGSVYNPDSGHRFDAELRLRSPNELKLRGYVLVPLLGGTERFTRVTQPLPACSSH